jgi:hypothetical protein
MFQRLKLRIKKKKKDGVPLTEKTLRQIMNEELETYIKEEDLREYLQTIEKDKHKKQLWDSLSPRVKLKLLRYALVKKGGKDAQNK